MTPEDKSKLEHKILIEELFGEEKTNKTPEAKLRDLEREELANPRPFIDLRLTPEEERAQHDGSWVSAPPDVTEELATAMFPLTEEQVNDIEERAMEYHKVTPPRGIVLDPLFAATGKSWQFEPGLETIRSGLIYFHEP